MSTTVKGLIFDLDGTLVDSLQDLGNAVNKALADCSMPTHPIDDYKYFVGDGMETLILHSAPEKTEPSVISTLMTLFRKYYGKSWSEFTRPYPGVVDMLENLKNRNIPMAVLSNKPHEFTLEVVRHFFPQIAFTIVQGSPAGGKAKPDPTLALGMAKNMKISPAQTAFVGDSRTDMLTAKYAEMLPVGVLWGFRPEKELTEHGARVILTRPDELFEKLNISQ